MASNYITASEIGDYVFCKRVWWLRTQGVNKITPQSIAGIKAHNQLAGFASLSWRVKAIALLLIGISILTLILIGLYTI